MQHRLPKAIFTLRMIKKMKRNALFLVWALFGFQVAPAWAESATTTIAQTPTETSSSAPASGVTQPSEAVFPGEALPYLAESTEEVSAVAHSTQEGDSRPPLQPTNGTVETQSGEYTRAPVAGGGIRVSTQQEGVPGRTDLIYDSNGRLRERIELSPNLELIRRERYFPDGTTWTITENLGRDRWGRIIGYVVTVNRPDGSPAYQYRADRNLRPVPGSRQDFPPPPPPRRPAQNPNPQTPPTSN